MNRQAKPFGGAQMLAKALRVHSDTVSRIAKAGVPIGVETAFKVARLAQVGVDDVLMGRWPAPGTCPHCARVERTEGGAVGMNLNFL